LPDRSARAGVKVTILQGSEPESSRAFDLVLADVPCSGSGAWRRSPEGKWRFDPPALERLLQVQASILDRAAGLVAPGGHLAYATCSLLQAENADQIAAFQARHPFALVASRRLTPLDGADGFYIAILKRV
ncbi:RsmB/NOP family class I SAM-dependent RNA methyltransferase, partial [Escherichia coli]|nr:RsmB/NOP family class I SAM-dependent RNA methyltransferase [Escherichia coli]